MHVLKEDFPLEETTNNAGQVKIENQELRHKLTKRNEQYLLGLDKTLKAANIAEERREEIYNRMMKELVNAQKTGKTARQMYGTVAECAEKLLGKPEADASERSADWLIAVDGGLLLGSIFALISGVSLLGANKGGAVGMGLISLILNFIIGGLAMLVISKFSPNPDAPKGKKGFGKYIFATTGSMLAWMLIMTVSMTFLPASINFELPAFAYIAVAVVGFVAKVFLKKKYHIVGGIL
jgi:uncharacterized membrane-anchored protein